MGQNAIRHLDEIQDGKAGTSAPRLRPQRSSSEGTRAADGGPPLGTRERAEWVVARNRGSTGTAGGGSSRLLGTQNGSSPYFG